MASDGPDKLDYRVMGDYSISKSYKGILRIAHIMETVGTEIIFSIPLTMVLQLP